MNQAMPEFSAVVRITPEVQEQLANSNALLTRVKGYVVESDAQAQTVNVDLQNIKSAAKNLDGIRKSIVKPLDEARSNAQAFFMPALDTLKNAEDHCKRLLLGWQEKIEAARREAQRKADEENRRIRAKQEAEAAAARAKAEEQAREARRKAEEAEAARQKAIAEGNARAAAEAAARAAKEQEKAQLIIEAAEAKIAYQEQVAPVIAPTPIAAPEIKGFSSRTVWKARVTDKQALIRSAAERTDIAALLLVDEKAANRLAGALKNALNVPGLEAYEEKVASSRMG